jgi:pimeloyl-ACP methyl ester carboxylesterase
VTLSFEHTILSGNILNIFMEVFFTKKGEGPVPIILLHGWGGSHASMAKLQDELAGRFTVYNLDLPGFGKSLLIKPAMTLIDYVEVLKKFIIEQNIVNPVLAGHSFGGKIITKLAIENSRQSKLSPSQPSIPLKAIVLIASSGINPMNDSKKSLMAKFAGFGKKIFSLPVLKNFSKPIRKFFYYYIVRERDFFDAGEKLRQTFINVNNENLDDDPAGLADIKTPSVIIWGQLDTVTPLWMGEKLARLIPGARLEVIEGARHNLVKVTPEIVSKIIYNNLEAE